MGNRQPRFKSVMVPMHSAATEGIYPFEMAYFRF